MQRQSDVSGAELFQVWFGGFFLMDINILELFYYFIIHMKFILYH